MLPSPQPPTAVTRAISRTHVVTRSRHRRTASPQPHTQLGTPSHRGHTVAVCAHTPPPAGRGRRRAASSRPCPTVLVHKTPVHVLCQCPEARPPDPSKWTLKGAGGPVLDVNTRSPKLQPLPGTTPSPVGSRSVELAPEMGDRAGPCRAILRGFLGKAHPLGRTAEPEDSCPRVPGWLSCHTSPPPPCRAFSWHPPG